MQDLHAAISLYTHGVITKDELRSIASVYYKVPLGKTNTNPFINAPYIQTTPYTTYPFTVTTSSSSVPQFTPAQQASQFQDTSSQVEAALGASIDERPTKCACKH